jgi:hypothetical protein
VSASDRHSCAIRTDGTLACWGNNDYGQATPPAGQFSAVSIGGDHSCAIRTDGSLTCWGSDRYGQATLPTPLTFTDPLQPWRATTAIALRWSATPAMADAPAASYDVGFRQVRWSGETGPWRTWRSATTATGGTFSASPGYTYCFRARARDAWGWTGDWSAETCTAVPLDDRSLARSRGWTAGTGSGSYRQTLLRTVTRDATLRRTGITAEGIALVAQTCWTCGKVKVYWNSAWVKTIDLSSVTSVKRRIIPIASFASDRRGTLTIRVVSSGRKVVIDGLAVWNPPSP